jgi:hypothetical protein
MTVKSRKWDVMSNGDNLWCVLSANNMILSHGLSEDEAQEHADDLMSIFPSYSYDGEGGYYFGVQCTPEYLRLKVELVDDDRFANLTGRW